MKYALNLLVAATVAAAVGFGGAFLSAPERSARGGADGPSSSELQATLQELRSEQERLAQRLAALPWAESAPAAAETTRVAVEDLDAAVAAFMERQAAAPAGGEGAAEAEVDPEGAALADRILSGALRGDELEALWQKLREEKRIDGVLAEIERQAALAPANPDLQSELGKAYLQKLFDVGIGPMASVYGEKADQAFDRALALDGTHWEARFEKALALSNWPTFLGKQGESMHQFEILMEQQERGAPSSEQVQTYFFLGNLYDQNGNHEQALATWRRGLARFPSHAGLLQKVEGR